MTPTPAQAAIIAKYKAVQMNAASFGNEETFYNSLANFTLYEVAYLKSIGSWPADYELKKKKD